MELRSVMDFTVRHISLFGPVIPPQPDVLLAGDGAVGPWSTRGSAPRTADGVDEVVQADEPCRWETQRLGRRLVCFYPKAAFPAPTWWAVARGGSVQRKKQKHQQRAPGAIDLHGYGTTADE